MLRVKKPETQIKLHDEQVRRLNNLAPTALVAAIILFLLAFFCESDELVSEYAMYTLLHHGILLINCLLWYFIRNRCMGLCLYMIPFQYAFYAGLILWFCSLDIGPKFNLFSMQENCANLLTNAIKLAAHDE